MWVLAHMSNVMEHVALRAVKRMTNWASMIVCLCFKMFDPSPSIET